ncbi:MAG: iron ABC transporter permease [Fusobacteriaceae bacterium]|jgi:iron complex transport system permease protein|nr:iron ABC transporter permease [Fusobacteriaceae bacterium]
MRKNFAKILFVLLIIVGVLAFSMGSVNIPIKDLLINRDIPGNTRIILFTLRLPRIIMAILVGMMLASSGAVVQSVFQNPLADPYIIGISSSATFGAVIAYIFKMPDFFYGVFSFVCCIISTFVIFKLSKRGNVVNVTTLLIVGIAMSAFLGAFTSFSMYLIGEDSFKITMWMMGYLGNATWSRVIILSVPLFFSILYFHFERYKLDALLSGDEEAHSMGVDIKKLKVRMLIVVALIVAFSVAFSGMIGFVGLIVPHILKMILGAVNSKSFPSIILGGGLFLLICDTLGRTMLSPIEIPIGVVTGFIGTPFFLYLALIKDRGVK